MSWVWTIRILSTDSSVWLIAWLLADCPNCASGVRNFCELRPCPCDIGHRQRWSPRLSQTQTLLILSWRSPPISYIHWYWRYWLRHVARSVVCISWPDDCRMTMTNAKCSRPTAPESRPTEPPMVFYQHHIKTDFTDQSKSMIPSICMYIRPRKAWIKICTNSHYMLLNPNPSILK